jgi:hypothetical protein
VAHKTSNGTRHVVLMQGWIGAQVVTITGFLGCGGIASTMKMKCLQDFMHLLFIFMYTLDSFVKMVVLLFTFCR